MQQLSPEDARILALESQVVAGHTSMVLFLGGAAPCGSRTSCPGWRTASGPSLACDSA